LETVLGGGGEEGVSDKSPSSVLSSSFLLNFNFVCFKPSVFFLGTATFFSFFSFLTSSPPSPSPLPSPSPFF